MSATTAPKRPESRRLQAQFAVRMLPEEGEKVRAAAAEMGITVGELFRDLLRKARVV